MVKARSDNFCERMFSNVRYEGVETVEEGAVAQLENFFNSISTVLINYVVLGSKMC